MKAALLAFLLPLQATAADNIFPASLPADRPAMEELTSGLRSRTKTLGLNGITVSSQAVSRALLLLPADRAQAGVMNFEIEAGTRAGVWQCEALGRGLTYFEAREGLVRSLIGQTTVYYIPFNLPDGATVPGVYDLRNITPADYEIRLLDRPGDLAADSDVLPSTGTGPRPHFTAAWRHWYSRVAPANPVDMLWAEGFQAGTQGEGRPLYERRPEPRGEAAKNLMEAQLAHNPGYYTGPYGRAGFAVHTDRWEDAERRNGTKYSGRPELSDFRFRDTNGCVKLRPACLAVFNEFVAEQQAKGRRVQLEVREYAFGPFR